jgi:hypothetical protein
MAKARLLALTCLLAMSGAVFAQTAPSAATLMSEAQTKAAKEKKAVWVIFHASW